MKKRLLSLVVVIALLISLPINAFALSSYTIPEGTTILDVVPMEYEVLVIPDDVLIISDIEGSATGQGVLRYVSLGDGVQYIGSNSFNGACIEAITIPNSVTYIGSNAFPTVTKVTLKSGAAKSLFSETSSTIFAEAFPVATTLIIDANYSDFTDIELQMIEARYSYFIPNSTIVFNDKTIVSNNYLTEGSSYIPYSAYQNSSYESLILPDSIKAIESYAFAYSAQLSYIDLANTETIGEYAFHECSNLTSVTIPSSVTSIGNNAFSSIKTVTFETASALNLLSDNSYEFNFYSTFPVVETVNIKTTSDNIDLSRIICNPSVQCVIFSDGDVWQRNKLFFSNNDTTIENYEYQGYALDSIVIPDNITIIGEYAFSNVTSENGTSLILGDNVTDIQTGAFENSSVNSIIFGSAPISIGENAFQNTTITSLKIPSNIVSIGANAFNTETLNALVLDASVLTGALSDNPIGMVFGTVNNIIIDGNLTEIPASLFSGTAASSISYSDKVVSIGAYAFNECQISQANIGDNVINIGESAYENTCISTLNIPDNVTYIGSNAFSHCTSLLFAKIGSGLTEISDGMFTECIALKTAVLPETITTIGTNAFNGCAALTNVNIPLTVTEIGANAFEGCTSLKSVVIPDGVTTIKTGTFKNCTSLESVTIPDSVTTIEEGAFEGCTSLDGLVIPENLEEIQTAAFKNCSALDTVVIPENVETVADEAFEGCSNITLAGCSGTAVETYATANSVTFYTVNAYPCQDTTFDFENDVVYTKNTVCDDIAQILKSSTGADVTFTDDYCATGSTITITKGDDIQTYTLIVDGDLNGDSSCDVLDASMANTFATDKAIPSVAQIYAAGGKNAETISVNEYSSLINKVVS